MTTDILQFRSARETDLPALVTLLASDPLGAGRERNASPLPESYLDAFAAIDADPNNELIIAESDGLIVGMLQLTVIPHLTYQGGWRAQVEGVRIHGDFRGRGYGNQIFQWAIQRARDKGCHLLQLTTDKSRPDALKFYETLGFKASHEGLKLHL